MKQIFKALGCRSAVNLDGGGSSQLLVREPSSDSYMIHNSPSDGAVRPVMTGWAVVALKGSTTRL